MAGNRREFDQKLEAIEAEVIELFAMIAEDLPRATAALLTGDSKVLPALAEHQQAIDALYPQMEAKISWEIMRQAPVAGDLRFLLSVLTIARDFERAHHSVVHIAARANHILSTDLSPRCRALLEHMGDLAAVMWRQAADAWYQRDRAAADTVAGRDRELDELYDALIAELASGAMTVPVTMELTLVARSYERLGDHAVIVARRVRYLAGSHTELTSGDG
jgi:phosphate transport system protein